MDLLQVKGNQIVDSRGREVRLRGTCIGGWMNMENFIVGYPGAVHTLMEACQREWGPQRTRFFHERFLDHFFNEDDVIFLRQCGATAIRIPVNYRHFEDDWRPFAYRPDGFERLRHALGWCERHGLYVILDLHAVAGGQNPDWHSDNATNCALFWQHPHFQDRFVALWEEFARQFRDEGVVAGYNVMNEPVTSRGSNNRNPYSAAAPSDWAALNAVYDRVVKAVRAIDGDHIIFLEGDFYSNRFSGLDDPPAPNLVYSSHNYMGPAMGPGSYPDSRRAGWDASAVAEAFGACEGQAFAAKHGVPLWVGEFGAIFNGPAAEAPDRLRALDDQLTAMEGRGAHWTTWTYKDVGVMGLAAVASDSPYMRAIKPVFDAKLKLHAEGWGWLPPSTVDAPFGELNRVIVETVGDPALTTDANRGHLAKAALSTYVAGLLQTPFARCFSGMSEGEMDRVLASFELRNCRRNQGQIDVLRRHMGGAA